jgi:hypothetical protein
MSYFDQLAERLRTAGVPADQVTATVDDLETYAGETGADPEAEFGPVHEFAEQLMLESEPDVRPDDEPWRWRADAFSELRKLATFGDQGWEVERVDSAGRFVSRRDAEHPQRWEYRREVIVPAKGSAALEEELAPDGWEPCGTWVCYAYFKRPRAASIGPDARIGQPRSRPERRTYFGGRFYALVAGLLALAAVLLTVVMLVGDRYVGGGFARGALAGGLVGAVGVVVVAAFFVKRAETRANRDE